jgi:hypothetical protein
MPHAFRGNRLAWLVQRGSSMGWSSSLRRGGWGALAVVAGTACAEGYEMPQGHDGAGEGVLGQDEGEPSSPAPDGVGGAGDLPIGDGSGGAPAGGGGQPGLGGQTGAGGAGPGGGGAAPPGSGCAHDLCQEGLALDPACDPCTASVCAADPFCCTNDWDVFCIEGVALECGYDCPGP